jgi:hypothetical protein
LLSSGLSPSQISALAALTPPQSYDDFLAGFSIPSGVTPTGASLQPLTSQLSSLAQTLPSGPAKDAITQLVNSLNAAGSGDVPSNLLDQLRGALALIGALTPNGVDALKKLLGSLIPVTPASSGASSAPSTGATPTPVTPVAPPVVTPFSLLLKVSKITVASNRKTASVTLRGTAPAAAVPVGFATTLGRKAAAKPVLFNLVPGKNVTKKVTLTRSATKTLKKKGGTLKVTPAFNVPGLSSVPGITLAETAKSLKVRKAHRAKRHKR